MSDDIPVTREEYLALRFLVAIESFLILAFIIHKLIVNRFHIHHHVKMTHHHTKRKIRDIHYNTKLAIAKAKTRLKIARALRTTHDFDARLSSPPQQRRIPGTSAKVAPQQDPELNTEKDDGSPRQASPTGKKEEAKGQKDYSWYIDPKTMRLNKDISKGTLGKIYIGEWLGLVVTAKHIDARTRANPEGICEASEQKLIQEMCKLSEIRHPNIVIFLGGCVKPKCYVVMEHCAHGTLKNWMDQQMKENIRIDMRIVLDFLSDIARGVRYAHEKYKMIVRNLQSSKIFIDEHLQAKISLTFGMSHELSGFKDDAYPAWSAPEILRGHDYNEKVDVYSFAIVIWELLTRKIPYKDVEELKQFEDPHEAIAFAVAEHEMRPEIPEWCPEPLGTLMEHCWSDDNYSRPDFNGIIKYLLRMKKVKEILEAHEQEHGPQAAIKSVHSPVNYQTPPGSQGKKKTYVKGPTKIPTPGGYIVLHTS